MALGLGLAWANRLIDRFQAPAVVAAGDRRQRRFLTGAALLGLAVALLSALSEIVRAQWVGVAVIAAFAAALCGILAGLKTGLPLATLSAACLAVLGCFFTGAALLTVEIQYGQLKWFALLPLVAVLLEGSPDVPVPRHGPTLRGATVAAALLGVFVIVAHRLGVTAGFHDTQTVSEKDVEQAVDFVLFACSVAGLLWVHRLAMRRTEEELALLRSMLSVCAWCKRIHDDGIGWIGIEQYMVRHGTTGLSHGICPDCAATVLDPPR